MQDPPAFVRLRGGDRPATAFSLVARRSSALSTHVLMEFAMGHLDEGRWVDTERRPTGQYVRSDTRFRNWITRNGAAGPSGAGGFEAEAGRYHLYVSLACPWASRTLIFRSLKGLEQMVGLSVTHWLMG